MLKKLLILMLCFVLIFSIAACGGETNVNSDEGSSENITYTKENPLVLKFNSGSASEEAIGSIGTLTFKKTLEELTDGRVRVDIYWAWGLGGGDFSAIMSGLQNQGFHFAEYPAAQYGEYTSAFQPLEVPYLLNRDIIDAAMTGEPGQIIKDKMLADCNIKVVGLYHVGFRHWVNRVREIQRPEDLKDIAFRIQPNALNVTWAQSMGALPSTIAFNELFTSLQTGIVDGCELPLQLIVRQGIHEVMDYLTISDHLFNVAGMLMDNDYFESLPEDIQEAILIAGEKNWEVTRDECLQVEAEWLDGLFAQYMDVYYMTEEDMAAFREAGTALEPEYIKLIGDEEYYYKLKESIEKLK